MVVEPAAHQVVRARGAELRVQPLREDVAVIHAGGAAGREAAAVRQLDEVGHRARDRRQLVADLAGHRHRADEPARVGMPRVGEERAHVGLLDDLAGVHDRGPVAHLGDHPEVVGDEDDGRAGLGLEGAHEVEDLGLDGHVERRRGLVGDEQLGLAGERDGDHDALRHAARHLVRVGLVATLDVGDAHHLHELEAALPTGPGHRARGGSRAPRRSAGRPSSPG